MLGPKNCKRKQIYKCQVCSHNLPKALKVGNNWAQILWATDAFVECFRSTSYSFGLCNTQKNSVLACYKTFSNSNFGLSCSSFQGNYLEGELAMFIVALNLQKILLKIL